MPNENTLPTPETRREMFLAAAAGESVEKPEPITREEMFLNAIGGGTSGAYTKAETDALLDGKADLVDGKVPLSELPPAVIERMVTVSDDTARFALTTATVQLGDTVKVTSTNKMYMVVDVEHLDSETGYEVYVAGRAAEAVADEDGNNIKSTYAKIANLETVATSGSYNDLSNKPTLGAAAAKGVDSTPTSSSTNLVESGGVYEAMVTITAELVELVDSVAKNLVALAAQPTSGNTQISGTISDGIVNLSTATAININSTVEISAASFYLSADKTYVLSGCPGNGNIRLFLVNSSTQFVAQQWGDEIEYTPESSGDYRLIVYMYSGVNVQNFEIKPMICTKSAWDISHKFVPYCPSMAEMYAMIQALQT